MPEHEMMAVPAARREVSDVTGLFIIGAFLGLVATIALLALLCWWLFPRAPHPGWMPYPAPKYPPPALEAAPHQDFVRFYRAELNRLNSLGWVNKKQGIAHIPVAQAMQEVAAHGIPGWPAASTSAGGGSK